MSRGIADRAADLHLAAGWAERIVSGGRSRWAGDVTLRLAGEAIGMRVGEAAAHLPESVQAQMPTVPWRELRGMRNFLAHQQHNINHDELWNALAVDIPHVQRAVTHWRLYGPSMPERLARPTRTADSLDRSR